jgi:ADP-ribose pyrophosphatase YjhB (NUDIX family)
MEDRDRAVCTRCGYIDYVNPINVVGTVPVWDEGGPEEQILLCRRSIQPRRGYWTVPAGFLEQGETLAAGAQRETWEEAGARIELGEVFTLLDVVHAGQVHIMFRARLLDLDLAPGPETIENRLFPPADLPWKSLAFLTVCRTLEHWVQDRQSGQFRLHTGSIERRR